ncbi:mycothiol-dependent nitroreductase Rv2466c family protein [Streptomyces daliensis]
MAQRQHEPAGRPAEPREGAYVADFWFDPACPYTWITSRWLLEVATVRPVSVRWRVMSLSVLNEHLDEDPEGDPDGYLWMPVRVCAAVEEEFGHEALGRFYTALGTRLHLGGDWDWRTLFPSSLAAAGLPERLAEAGGSTAYDAAVRASHEAGTGLVGEDVGTPVIAVRPADGGVDGGGATTAFFGPCVSPTPRGEAAGRLWDGVLLMAGVAGFYEFKRAPAEPDFTV